MKVYFFSVEKDKMYVFKCIWMSLVVIDVIFFPSLNAKEKDILHVLQFNLQKLDWCIEWGPWKAVFDSKAL